MTNPKTLRDLLAEGQLQLRTREEIERNADAEDAATERWMEATRASSALGPRKPGRPILNQPRRITRVRSLRLEETLWEQIDSLADYIGCSVNRFIEQAVQNRIREILEVPAPAWMPNAEWKVDDRRLVTESPQGPATEKILTFKPMVAA